MVQKYERNINFLQFLIIDFYPSITKELLLHSINSAKNYTDITQGELDIILAFRKSVLINNDTTWVRTETDDLDVTMGSLDSAQIADLVCIYILDILGKITNLNNIGI